MSITGEHCQKKQFDAQHFSDVEGKWYVFIKYRPYLYTEQSKCLRILRVSHSLSEIPIVI